MFCEPFQIEGYHFEVYLFSKMILQKKMERRQKRRDQQRVAEQQAEARAIAKAHELEEERKRERVPTPPPHGDHKATHNGTHHHDSHYEHVCTPKPPSPMGVSPKSSPLAKTGSPKPPVGGSRPHATSTFTGSVHIHMVSTRLIYSTLISNLITRSNFKH